MATKVYCDLCGMFIAEFKRIPKKDHELNRASIISVYYEGKSLDDEDIGWSEPKEKIEFWACEECNRKFMDAVKKLAKGMGYND